MFKQSLFLGAGALMLAAFLVLVPAGSAQVGTVRSTVVDDVLDNPEAYIGQEITLEGEVDRVSSSMSFVIEDDADLFGEDYIPVISVMPDAMLSDLDRDMSVGIGELKEGKVVQATGIIRRWNLTELQNEFGVLDIGDLADDFEEGHPVLIMGARDFAAAHQEPMIQEPAPTPEADIDEGIDQDLDQPEMDAEEELGPAEPAPELDTEIEEPVEDTEVERDVERDMERLPQTATGMPAVGLIGLLSFALAFAIRLFR